MSYNSRPSGSGAQCPTHPDMNLIEDYSTGDLTRPERGLVVGDRMVDTGSDRTFSKDKSAGDPSPVGSENPLLIGGHLSTPIGRSSTEVAFGESRVPKNRKRKHISSSDRELMSAFREVSDMSDRIHVSKDIIDRAHHLFKQVHDRRALKGRRNAAVCTACLYIACRQGVVPRTFKEICAVSKVSKKEIGRCFQSILKALDISLDSITNEDFMSRFCATLGLPSSVQSAATHIARKAVELDIVPGLSPMSVTAAAIYMASQASEDKKGEKEIADIAGVSDVTIRQTYKLMVTKATELFPPEFKFFTPIETLPQL